MQRDSPICDWLARTRYSPNEPARSLFFDIGIYAYTCRCCFWPPASYAYQQKRGHEPCARPISFLPLLVPWVISYIIYIEMSSLCDD